ncbi:MAG: Holliday junction resolvase RuvX [Tissierellales bacterium]|jgi:putative holliday junction resolvase|nr:Holliday junction resolvase RuvX [Tissierellales bacterium]MBN2828193.1 Holliday junction resolvase RuvX [Tissierellales bacterium]
MKRYMSLDVGDQTIGVAVSDPLNITAQGIKTIRRVSYKKDFEELKNIIEQYRVTTIIVGFPRRLDGSTGIQAEKVQQFVKKMSFQFQQEIIYEDERLTTAMAQKQLISGNASREKRKEVIDMLAAVNILTTFLNREEVNHDGR